MDALATKRRRRKAENMFPLIEQYLDSGQKQDDFCQAHDLPKSVFAYWLARYRAAADSSTEGFVEVVPPERGTATAGIELEYPNGLKIRLPGEIAPDDLRMFIDLAD